MQNDLIVGAYWVPGLPHILKPEENQGYRTLNDACQKVAEAIEASGAERIVFYSTGWLSVLGTSFQFKTDLKGLHVDENWHDFGDLPFAFGVDADLSEAMRAESSKDGFATAAIDYEGFPVDTGTIVANTLVNPSNKKVSMVSSSVYLDFDATVKLGQSCAKGIAASGKKTAVVIVSSLSGRFYTSAIDLREDHIRDPADEQWNRKMLGHLTNCDFAQFEQQIPAYCNETKADMGLKAYAFARGMAGDSWTQTKPKLHAYGSIYGTGAAVVEFASP